MVHPQRADPFRVLSKVGLDVYEHGGRHGAEEYRDQHEPGEHRPEGPVQLRHEAPAATWCVRVGGALSTSMALVARIRASAFGRWIRCTHPPVRRRPRGGHYVGHRQAARTRRRCPTDRHSRTDPKAPS